MDYILIYFCAYVAIRPIVYFFLIKRDVHSPLFLSVFKNIRISIITKAFIFKRIYEILLI